MKMLGKDFLTSVALTSMMAPVVEPTSTVSHHVTGVPDADDAESCATTLPAKLDFELDGFYLGRQKFAVPGVDAELKLRRVPRMVIRDFTSCCIDDWGVEVSPATKATAEEMASSSVRKFLGLYYKSQQGTLTVEDRKVWRQMLADFDSDMYVEVSAPAVQTLGVLKSLKPKYAIVQWSDDPGEDDRVDGVFRTRLSCLHEGDMFSATVKFVAGKLVSLDNVFPCNV